MDQTWRAFLRRGALLSLMVVALGGCAAQATVGVSGQTPTPFTTPTAEAASNVTPPTSTQQPTPTNVVIAGTPGDYGPTCQPNQLTLALKPLGAAMGNVGAMAHFTNTSTTACSLYGFPGAQLLDAQHNPMPTQVHWQTSAYLYNVPVQHVRLAPGAAAYFVVEWTDVPPGTATSCLASGYLEVTPPNDYSAITIAAQIAACRSDLYISPVEPTATNFVGG